MRVLVGADAMATEMGQVGAPAYAHVQLRWDAERNGFASEQQGRPVFERVLVLRHIYPGTTDTLDVQVKRFPDEGAPVVLDPKRYEMFRPVLERFERDGAAAASGTPLSTINLDPAQIATLQASGVQSVESLADVADAVLDRLGMGARGMRDRAVAFFAALQGNAPIAALQSENERLVAEQADQRQTLAEYKAEMAALRVELAAKADAKPGRKGGDA